MIVKCKPVYNFQSVEFEFEIDPNSEEYENQLEQLFDIFVDMLDGLEEIAPEQQKVQNVAPRSAKKEELASENQKKYLDRLGIPYPDDITKKEAFNLIKEVQGK